MTDKPPKVGLDDLTTRGMTRAQLEGLPRTTGRAKKQKTPSVRPNVARYLIADRQICRQKQTREGPIVEPLCNFTAEVTEELLVDDGAEASRTFTLTGQLAGGQTFPLVRIPAARFASMGWVSEHWGLEAVIRAGLSTRDALREAIQVLSPAAQKRTIYAHTGWRQIGDAWVYLTSAGAVGGPECDVMLGSSELERYRLPAPPTDAVSAVRASLALLDVAASEITVPLLAAMVRAPLAAVLPCDVTIWLEGSTGTFKSTVTALFLSHYGAFTELTLPGAWSSTANALERQAFVLKDVPFVIDDYAPQSAEARELQQKAERLIREQGNLSGRGRLRSDLTMRPTYTPRGILIATGEQHPPGRSLVARLVVVQVRDEAVDRECLTRAQAAAGLLPQAMSAYIAWLAPKMATLGAALREAFLRYRTARSDGAVAHRRVPQNLAQLAIGLDTYLDFAEAIGAVTAEIRQTLETRVSAVLTDLAEQQQQALAVERPVERFLRGLLALLMSKQNVLVDKMAVDTAEPPIMLGWADEAWLLLIPEASYRAIARFYREAGEPFPTRQGRLCEELVEAGLADHDDGHLTRLVRIGAKRRRVLRLDLDKVETLLGEEFPPPWKPPTPDREERDR